MTASSIGDIRRQVFSHDSDDLEHIWTQQPGLIRFLDSQAQSERTVLFAGVRDSEDRSIGWGRLWVWTVLVPKSTFASINADDRHDWEQPHECGMWRLWKDEKAPVMVSKEHFSLGGRPLSDGQQLVYPRRFLGREQDKSYCEIDQRLLQAHRLHWTPERRAWCRFDEDEDVEDVINWYSDESDKSECESESIVVMDREALDRYMTATDTVLIQMFDSALLPSPATLGPVTDQVDDKRHDDTSTFERYYERHVNECGSRYRGIQIVTSRYSATELGKKMETERHPVRQYETFLFGDTNGETIGEASCDPVFLRNPHWDETSDNPSEMSPVYFKPGVLDRYKSDPDKYKLTSRKICRRGGMLLQTYHVNRANQVVTYLYYLGLLPYDEQRYWKSYNERPKDGISEEAFSTDFRGRLFKGPNALRDLRHLVETRLADVKWYRTANPDLLDELSLPISDSKKQWNEAIGLLCKIVNDRLDKSYFRRAVGTSGNRTDEKNWGSIRWMQEALLAVGEDEGRAREITEPFRDLQKLRSKLYAHDSGSEKPALYESLLRKHGRPREHVQDLCERLHTSLECLLEHWPEDRGK